MPFCHDKTYISKPHKATGSETDKALRQG